MISYFNSVSGVLTRKFAGAQGSQLCLDNNGVEYIFETSRASLQALPEAGREARVYAYLVHREDSLYLCGFASEAERAMFVELIGVDGIGPKQALKTLGAVGHASLERLLESGDVDGLERLPGIGKKTAQKMVLALKGKLNVAALENKSAAAAGLGLGEHEDVAQALVAMGYERKSVAEAIRSAAPELEDLPREQREQELMRRVMVALG